MVNCPSCGAKNLDNSRYCCQCAEVLSSGRREFVPMCDNKGNNKEKRVFQSIDDFAHSDNPAQNSASKTETFNNNIKDNNTPIESVQNNTESSKKPAKNRRRPVETSCAFALEDKFYDGEDDYSSFRMRDPSEVFSGDESKVFSNELKDAKADKKRKRDSAKLVKRAEKRAEKKRKNGEDDMDTSSVTDWQGDDFWQ